MAAMRCQTIRAPMSAADGDWQRVPNRLRDTHHIIYVWLVADLAGWRLHARTRCLDSLDFAG